MTSQARFSNTQVYGAAPVAERFVHPDDLADCIAKVEIPAFSNAARECLAAESAVTEQNVRDDISRLALATVTAEDLLAECLDGADDDRQAGWVDYVNACCDAAEVPSL